MTLPLTKAEMKRAICAGKEAGAARVILLDGDLVFDLAPSNEVKSNGRPNNHNPWDDCDEQEGDD